MFKNTRDYRILGSCLDNDERVEILKTESNYHVVLAYTTQKNKNKNKTKKVDKN